MNTKEIKKARRLRPLKKTSRPLLDVLMVVRMHSEQFGERVQQVDGIEPSLGQFAVVNGRIYCPKKKGETIRVRYTEIHEETL